MTFQMEIRYDDESSPVAEWRNWQTHQTQNLAKFTLRVGSTPTSATTHCFKDLSGL